MGWKVIDHMFGPSPVCTACSQAPRDEHDNFRPAYNADGVDVDWGNHLFICGACMDVLVELHGSMRVDDADKMRRKLELTEEQLEATELQLAQQEERINSMLSGAQARKDLKTRKATA
jgi:hypothetical protein